MPDLEAIDRQIVALKRLPQALAIDSFKRTGNALHAWRAIQHWLLEDPASRR